MTRPRSAMLVLALVTTSMASLPEAVAEDVLVVGGSAKEPAQIAAVRGAVERALHNAGWVWPDRPVTPTEAESLLRCESSSAPWTCIPSTIGGLRAQEVHRVFVASVDHSQPPSAPMIVLTAKVIVASPPAFVVRQRFCERCSAAQLARITEDLTRQLVDELRARTGATTIAVRSEPQGADITIDGVHAGATNATLASSPGTHVVVVEKPGFFPETRALAVEDGQAAEVSVALRSTAAQPPTAGSPAGTTTAGRSSRLVPGIAIASGVALVGFGGVALYDGQKDGPDDRFRYTRATAVGVVSGIVGLAAIGAGVYLWRGPDGSGLVGTIHGGTTLLAWAGEFR